MRLFNSAHIGVFAGLIRRGCGLRRIRLTVRYGLIDLGQRGLCLVDTGVGTDVTQGQRSTALRLYHSVLRPPLNATEAPEAVIRQLGKDVGDVRFVVATH